MATRKTTSSAKPFTAKKSAVVRSVTALPKNAKVEMPSAKAAAATTKDAKIKKMKMIRDSFTMPSSDYDLIAELKAKALGGKSVVKKSELLRAGLHALNKLQPVHLIALLGTLTIVKTGRPKK